MTYSCAVFDRPSVTLAEAQEAKIDRLCTKLELGPRDHLVEIGSGWGSLAVHAATRYGCRVTTTTISDAQHTYVDKRVADAGLSDRIAVLGVDWRDLSGRFDKLVSVEMVEAVDWRWHDRFVAKCADLLVDDGLAAIQAIVIDDRSFERAKRHRDFVRRMVFPGGCLPSVASLTASLARATDLRIVDLEDIGLHYAETLRRWAGNLAACATRWRLSGWGRSSAVSGTSTWPTARLRFSNVTSATSSSYWPSPPGLADWGRDLADGRCPASSAGSREVLDDSDQLVAPPAAEAVGPQPTRLVGVGDGGAAEEHRGVRECGSQTGDDSPGRGFEAWVVHAMATASRSGAAATTLGSASAGVLPRARSR